MNEAIRIISAEWNLRPKTKFLTVDGYVTVESPDDEVTAEIAIPQGINHEILLIRVTVNPSKGPKKPQPAPFYFREMTTGTEPWTHVQVVINSDSDTMRITTLQWANNGQ